jgi:hypothetical protein
VKERGGDPANETHYEFVVRAYEGRRALGDRPGDELKGRFRRCKHGYKGCRDTDEQIQTKRM